MVRRLFIPSAESFQLGVRQYLQLVRGKVKIHLVQGEGDERI